MDLSFSQNITTICSECKQSFSKDVWIILDQNSRPELIEQLKQENLNTLVCPQCNHQMGTADEPLLIYRPNQQPPLIFSHAEKNILGEDQAHNMHRLVQHLLQDLHRDDQEWVMEGLKRVPRQQLANFLGKTEH